MSDSAPKPSQNDRNHYRIDDTVGLSYTLEGEAAKSKQTKKSGTPESIDKLHVAMNALKSIGGDNKLLVSSIQEQHPQVAQYFDILNKKIEMLTRLILCDNYLEIKQVNLSIGGLAFNTDYEVPPATLMDIELTLYPDYEFIATRARVIRCKTSQNRQFPHRWAIEFMGLSKTTQDILARHIFRKQAESLRAINKLGDK